MIGGAKGRTREDRNRANWYRSAGWSCGRDRSQWLAIRDRIMETFKFNIDPYLRTLQRHF